MKRILSFFATFLVSFSLFAQNNSSAAAANRRTAIRYLQNAKQQAADKHWAEAKSLSQTGLEYDDSIADLWYVNAVSCYNLGDTRSKILDLIEKNFNKKNSNWVDYNKDNARILYADILCSTLHFNEALKILDAEPFIYSADAEFIRIKSYYSIGDEANLRKARSRIDTARRVYPEDVRFVELFYNFEYKINFLNVAKDSKLNSEVQKIANSFASSIKSKKFYKKINDDLIFLSYIFNQDSEEKIRLMKVFNSEKHNSVHFAEHALVNGIFDETSALDYFYKYADSTDSIPLNFDILKSFILKLQKEESIKEISEYLNSYNGTIAFDTDGDLEDNMKVIYKRGRPQNIYFDKNQDGIEEWSAVCDFGVPQSVHVSKNNLDLIYGNWPAVQTATYKNPNYKPKLDDLASSEFNQKSLSFNLISDTLFWAPFKIDVDSDIKEKIALDFFRPFPQKNMSVSGTDLLVASSYYTMPSNERQNAFIQVTVLSGTPQNSKYFECSSEKMDDAKLYAVAQFENGIPVLRLVDSDGDGLFETTEHYGFTTDLSRKYITENDEMQIIANLFGPSIANTGFYVKMIQLDQNGDTIPDFTEEYTEGYGKISSWDTDGDGKWDVKYVKHPQKKDSKIVKEDSIFHQPFTNEIVTVSMEDGIPKTVSIGNKSRLKVFPSDISNNFYWISEKNTEFGKIIEEKIIREFANEHQGISKIVQISAPLESKLDGARFYAVKIGSMIFAEQIVSK